MGQIEVKTERAFGEIEIFRAGRHKPMNGPSRMFSQAMLEEVAANFDQQTNPAPVVIGHPKLNAPAYAWAKTVFVEGNILKATLAKVDPKFAKIVDDGRYKRISAAFYAPEADNNPTPGKWSLRHIGFLGAAAPAVKGLKPVEFCESEKGILSFGEEDFIDLPPEFEHRLRHYENERFIEGLMRNGKVLPAHGPELVAFMDAMDDSHSVAFADGSESAPLDWLRDFLNEQPAHIPYGRVIDSSLVEGQEAPQFAAPDGYEVDREGLGMHQKAMKIMREKGVRFEDAVEMIYGD